METDAMMSGFMPGTTWVLRQRVAEMTPCPSCGAVTRYRPEREGIIVTCNGVSDGYTCAVCMVFVPHEGFILITGPKELWGYDPRWAGLRQAVVPYPWLEPLAPARPLAEIPSDRLCGQCASRLRSRV